MDKVGLVGSRSNDMYSVEGTKRKTVDKGHQFLDRMLHGLRLVRKYLNIFV